MSQQTSIVAAYCSTNKSSVDAMIAQIEAGDFSNLRCADILSFEVDAGALAQNFEAMCAGNADLVADLRTLFSEGVRVLRLAPQSGVHVALLKLEDFLHRFD